MTPTSSRSIVAYLGPAGTFAHSVAKSRFGSSSTLVPCLSIRDVFDRVISRAATNGIVPLENSSGGWVYETVDQLIENASKIQIEEELPIDVKLVLVGHKNQPVENIYSHFAPLNHYEKWLDSHYPTAKRIKCDSTTQAAESAKKDPKGAALSAKEAAELYGLDVLNDKISPDEINVTKFFQISLEGKNDNKGEKLGLVVTLKDHPGSLVEFLIPFSDAGLNLTRIISRPIHRQPGAYHFLIEVNGKENDPKLEKVLVEAKKRSKSLTSLGNYVVKPTL